MSPRFNLRPADHLPSPGGKQFLTREIFAEVAPKYDFITKALSLGRDAGWKRRLVAELPDHPAPTCADLACGTGDIARLLARRYVRGQVAGIDLVPSMLAIARRCTCESNVAYVEGNMDKLPFADDSLDIVTGGYALRNAPELGRALDEIRRVLRPGGHAAFLDFSKPRHAAGRFATHAVLKVWGGFWGLLLHGNPDVYGYIADSLGYFPDRTTLREMLAQRHLCVLNSHRCYGGIVEQLHVQKTM